MTCLSRDRLIEAVEGNSAPDTEAHLATCARCRTEVDSLRRTLDEVRGVDVPEPSPLFWDHLTARVREAVAAEPMPDTSWLGVRGWLFPGQSFRGRGWQRPAIAVAIVVLVAVLVDFGARRPGKAPGAIEPPASAHANAPGDLAAGDDWQFIVDVAMQSVDLAGAEAGAETVMDASSGSSELAVSQLSADERRELVRLLNDELAPGANESGTSGAERRDKGAV